MNKKIKESINNKKIIFYLILSSILLLNIFTIKVEGLFSDFYKIKITMVNQQPDQAEAGRYVTVRFKIENEGGENAEDVTLELLPNYPFSLDPGKSPLQYIGSVYSRQIGDVGVIIDYRLKVDENALEGDNEIELRYKIKNGAWVKLEPFYINIKPHDILLGIANIDAPKMIEPGKTSRVDINLKNLALTFVKDIKIKLDLSSVPFATVDSTNKKIIKQMEANSSAKVSFDLMAESNADSKLYKIPIEIEFLDRLGTRYTTNETVGLIIGAEPDFGVIIDSYDMYEDGNTNKIVVKFVNKGVVDIKFLNVILKESNNFDVLSPTNVYVGHIDSDDYETADFKLLFKKIEDEITLPLLIEYKDPNNNDYSKEVNLDLKSYFTLKSSSFNKGNVWMGAALVLIIIVGGIFLYLRYRKSRK